MDFNGPQKIDIFKKLEDPLHAKSHQKKFHLKRLRNCRVMACNVMLLADRNSACAAWNTAMLKGHCFVSRLDCLHLKSNHAKFQLNPISNG